MSFGFSNGPLPAKDEVTNEPETSESGATLTEEEAVDVLFDLASTLHVIASTAKDHKVIRTAINALVRHRIDFNELTEK